MAETTNDGGHTKHSRMNMTFLTPASPDAPANLQRASKRYITVEPIAFCLMISFGCIVVVLPQYLRVVIAEQRNIPLPNRNRANGSCVAVNTSNPYYIALQDIQAEVKEYGHLTSNDRFSLFCRII